MVTKDIGQQRINVGAADAGDQRPRGPVALACAQPETVAAAAAAGAASDDCAAGIAGGVPAFRISNDWCAIDEQKWSIF